MKSITNLVRITYNRDLFSPQLCVILEPMQELMSRHKAYSLSPRDCLKTTLFQKWQRMVAPPGKRGTILLHKNQPRTLTFPPTFPFPLLHPHPPMPINASPRYFMFPSPLTPFLILLFVAFMLFTLKKENLPCFLIFIFFLFFLFIFLQPPPKHIRKTEKQTTKFLLPYHAPRSCVLLCVDLSRLMFFQKKIIL
jgi:hypothetical protein